MHSPLLHVHIHVLVERSWFMTFASVEVSKMLAAGEAGANAQRSRFLFSGRFASFLTRNLHLGPTSLRQMDSPGDWTASALFSPSKARVQQAQAKDWASVDAWLAKKYQGKRIPTFERNEDTLQALLTLANFNDSADEQRSLVEKVERQALSASTKRDPESATVCQDVVAALNIEGRESLDALCRSLCLLGSDDMLCAAESLCKVMNESFEVEEQLKRAAFQHATLNREQSRLTGLLHDMQQDHFAAPHDIIEQTSEWSRNTKHLKAKIAEYDERLSALRSPTSARMLAEDVSHKSNDVEAQKVRLQVLQGELAALDSLPSDPKAARTKLDDTRTELRRLAEQRDALFEAMLTRR